jgi:predicted permease
VLLRALLPGSVHEALAGDLEERFAHRAATDPGAARRSYWKDILSPTLLRLRREARGMPLPPGSPPGTGKGDGIVSSLLADVKFALRTLAKAPAFAAIAVLSLALGIGPNTAIFSLVDSVLFQDWGVTDPEGVVDVYTLTDEGEYFFSGYGTYELVAEGTDDVFEAVTQHSVFTGRIEGSDGESELVLGEMVAGDYFDVMGVRAALGRTFAPEEDATLETHPVMLVSDDFWRTRHGSDPGLVGREIRLNGRPYTVIGITPPEFRGRTAPGIGSDFWVPFSMYPHLSPGKMGSGDLTITGRVRAGVDPARAIAAVETVGTRFDERLNAANPERRSRFRLAAVSLADVRLHPNFDGVLTAIAALLFAAVGLVLLVACVNLAGFLLSRSVERRKEMAVRVAMGAGRGAILRQLVVESLVLSGLGAALGLILGQVAIRALSRVQLPIPVPMELEIGLSLPLLMFTAGTAVLAAVVFGLTPALEATRAPVAATLRDEAGSSGGRGKIGARGILVASQMALSTILLFTSALFMRSLQSAGDMDLGFSTRAGAVVKVESTANEYTAEERLAFVDELGRRLESQPGVDAFGFTARMPLDLGMSVTSFDVPGVEPPANENRHRLETARITPGYFDAMGIAVHEGRDFTAADREGAENVVILSQAAAQRYWPGESALGRVLYRGGDSEDPLTVVGVAGNVKIWSLGEPPKPYLYLPYHQGGANATFFATARGSAPPADLAALIRNEARAIDPEIFLTEVKTVEEHLGYIYFLPRMAALLLSLVGALALVLACIGLYGMVSYGVSRRTREMGIRLAMGAEQGAVVNLVLRSGMRLVALGGVVGIVAALGMGRFVGRFLYGIGGLDPVALLVAPLLLAGIAAVAAYVPARRASRVDPVQALRTE